VDGIYCQHAHCALDLLSKPSVTFVFEALIHQLCSVLFSVRNFVHTVDQRDLGCFIMRASHVQALLLAPLSVQAIRIVLSNDDGWAAKTVRVFVDTLTAAGQTVVLSGPAENKSGSCRNKLPLSMVVGHLC
jgi:hypothetical protein